MEVDCRGRYGFFIYDRDFLILFVTLYLVGGYVGLGWVGLGGREVRVIGS